MAGPQIQRPQSAYYTGLNGSSNSQRGTGDVDGGGVSGALTTSTSHHTGLHAIRTISHNSELIYRGTNGNTHNLNNTSDSTSSLHGGGGSGSVGGGLASTSRSIIQQQPTLLHTSPIAPPLPPGVEASVATIAGTGQNPSDALIVPAAAATLAVASRHPSADPTSNSPHSNTAPSKGKQRSIEIIVDAEKCEDDIEQGKSRRSSRHRHRPLHRRFLTYLKSLFHSTTTQTGKIC